MKIETIEGQKSRKILIGMIVDKMVLSKLSPIWKMDMFRSKWENIVSKWCANYYRRFRKAPKDKIEQLYAAWAEKHKDKSTVDIVGKFLGGLSGEYEQMRKGINADLLVDSAAAYFTETEITRRIEKAQGYIASGEIDRAIELFPKDKVEVGLGSGIDLWQDVDGAIEDCLVDIDSEILISYPGAAGEFFQSHLSRDSFVAVLAPEKRGKTFQLVDWAFRASVIDKRKVAFFEIGDMSRKQVRRRYVSRLMRRPAYNPTLIWPYKVMMPERISYNAEEEISYVSGTEHKFAKPKAIDIERAYEKVNDLECKFKLSVHPTRSINVEGIRSVLDRWEDAEGYIPDVIAIDYADILAPPNEAARFEYRQQIDISWQQMRNLSQEKHCLVLTATQAKRSGYAKKVLEMDDISEEKRKIAHVTGLVGVNVTPQEKINHVARLNWVAVREGSFDETTCVHVARCLPIADSICCSTWADR